MLEVRDIYESHRKKPHDAVCFETDSREEMLEKAKTMAYGDVTRTALFAADYIRSWASPRTEHANNIGSQNLEINEFIYEALAASDDSLNRGRACFTGAQNRRIRRRRDGAS